MHTEQEKPILTLRSCCLYQTDVALFADCAWLNDACIAFYFEVLQAKADVIFGRVALVAEESKKHSERFAFLHNDCVQEEEEANGMENFEMQCECSKPAGEEERRVRSLAAASIGSKGENVGRQGLAISRRGGTQIVGEESLYGEKSDCCSFRSKSKKDMGDGRGAAEEKMWWCFNSTREKVEQNDTDWLPILSSLIIVKPKQHADPSDAARVRTKCAGEHNSKSHSCKYIPRFQTSEDRYTPVLFVDPCVAFWLAFSDEEDEIKTVLENLSLEKRQVVLWPISDKQNLGAPGGTHWTLLVQVVQEKPFPLKHDSVKKSDVREAHAEVACTGQIELDSTQLCREYRFFHLNSLPLRSTFSASVAAAEQLQRRILAHLKLPHQRVSHTKSTLEVIECTCPQTNASDCGVYCLMYAENILAVLTHWWADKAEGIVEWWEQLENSELHVSVDHMVGERKSRSFSLNFQDIQRIQPAEALAKRKAIALLIQNLRNG